MPIIPVLILNCQYPEPLRPFFLGARDKLEAHIPSMLVCEGNTHPMIEVLGQGSNTTRIRVTVQHLSEIPDQPAKRELAHHITGILCSHLGKDNSVVVYEQPDVQIIGSSRPKLLATHNLFFEDVEEEISQLRPSPCQ